MIRKCPVCGRIFKSHFEVTVMKEILRRRAKKKEYLRLRRYVRGLPVDKSKNLSTGYPQVIHRQDAHKQRVF